MSSVTFNNLALADGQRHRLLFHLRGLQQQPGGVELHLDCRLVETVRDLPAVFQGLPAGYGMVELKAMQKKEQVTKECPPAPRFQNRFSKIVKSTVHGSSKRVTLQHFVSL